MTIFSFPFLIQMNCNCRVAEMKNLWQILFDMQITPVDDEVFQFPQKVYAIKLYVYRPFALHVWSQLMATVSIGIHFYV